MRKIHCNECGSFLFETDKSDGAAAVEAQQLGFISKMPFLYTGKPGVLFFCNAECQGPYFDKHIPKDPEVNKKLAEMKAKIPEMAADCAKKAAKFMEVLNRIKNRKQI